MPLFWLSLAFLSGIFVDSLLPLSWPVWLGTALFPLALLAVRPLRQPHPRLKLPLLLLAAALACGGLRLSLAQPVLTPHTLAYYNALPTSLQLNGWISAPPDIRERTTLLRVDVEQIQLSNGWLLPVHGKLVAVLPSTGAWHYGDRLTLDARLTDPPDSEDFSYRDYLSRQGVFSYTTYPRTTRSGTGAGSPLYSGLYALREQASRVLKQLFPTPEAPLLSGILLGLDNNIPLGLVQAFQATGTSHIIAISGFNMAILAGLFSFLFRKVVSRWWALLASLTAVALYSIMVGAGPAVIRAAIMSSLALVAIEIGRPAGGLNSLLLAAGIMCLGSPNLLWDVSFQLSFTATLGLVLYAGPLQGGVTRLLEKRLSPGLARRIAGPVGEYLLFTLAAQATTLPVMVYHFRRLSLSALLANPLALPPQPPLMILGGAAVLAGMLFEPLGRLLAALAWPLVAYTVRVVELLAQLPGSLSFGHISPLAVAAYYLLLLGLTFGREQIKSFRPALKPAAALLACGALALFAWRCALSAPDGRLHLLIYNLEGRAVVLVRAPGGETALINAPPQAGPLEDQLGRWLPPFYRQIDVLALPAPDSLTSLPTLLNDYPPAAAFTCFDPPNSSAGRALKSWSAGAQIPLTRLESGRTLHLGSAVTLSFPAASPDGCAVMLEMGRLRALLPGALQPAGLPAEISAAPGLLIRAAPQLQTQAPSPWPGLPRTDLLLYPLPVSLPHSTGQLTPPPGTWLHLTSDGISVWLEEGS